MRRLHVHKHATVIQNSLTYTCNSCKYTAKLPTYSFTEPTCCMLFLSFICKVGFREGYVENKKQKKDSKENTLPIHTV